MGESKVVAGGHFGIFSQPAGHCGDDNQEAAAAAAAVGAMTGGPAGGGEKEEAEEEGGEEEKGSDRQGTERARERQVRHGASGPPRPPRPARGPHPFPLRAHRHTYTPSAVTYHR